MSDNEPEMPDASHLAYSGDRQEVARLVRQAVTALPTGTLYNSDRAIDEIAGMIANAYLLGKLHGRGAA